MSLDYLGLSSLDQLVREACAEYGGSPAYTCMGKTISYRELDCLSQQFAAFLRDELKLKKGDRVAIQLPNILQYPVVATACFYAELVIVNTNPLYTSNELLHQLKDSNAKVLVVLANSASVAAKIIPLTSVEHVIVTQLGDLHGPIKGCLINVLGRYLQGGVLSSPFVKSTTFKGALRIGGTHKKSDENANENNVSEGKRKVNGNGLALLQYTGGTTGVSKAAMLSHRNLIANMLQLKERFAHENILAGEVMISPLPLYHIYAFLINFVYDIHTGLHTVLVPNPRNLPSLVKLLGRYSFTGFIGINTLYKALLEQPHFSKLNFNKFKISSSGGMSLSVEVSEQWKKTTGCQIMEGYGLTEASPCVSCNSSSIYRGGTIGLPVIETDIKVIDELGSRLAAGEAGELCVKGPQVMRGYWNQKEESTRVLSKDGWLKTGDVAIITEDGYLCIVDRIKDMINVSGFNVYPNEIEEYVNQHPLVNESVAVPERVGTSEERVKLIVVCKREVPSESELKKYCREGLAPYKVPREIEYRDHLPKSNIGKVLRRELRNEGVFEIKVNGKGKA